MYSNSPLVIVSLPVDYTQQVPRIRLIRLGLQDQAVDLLGGLQPTGFMVLDGNRQGLGQCCHEAIMTTPPASRNLFQEKGRCVPCHG